MSPAEKMSAMKGLAVPHRVIDNFRHQIEHLGEVSDAVSADEEADVLDFEGYQIDFRSQSYNSQYLERYEANPEAFELVHPLKDVDTLKFTCEGTIFIQTVARLKSRRLDSVKKSEVLRLRSSIMSETCQAIWDEIDANQVSRLDSLANLTKDERLALLESFSDMIRLTMQRILTRPTAPMEAYRKDTDSEELWPEGGSQAKLTNGQSRVAMSVLYDQAAPYLTEDYTVVGEIIATTATFTVPT